MGTRQVEVTIPFQVKKDKREAPGEITLPPEGVPNKPLGFIILHGAARGKHNAHATATMTAYATTLAKAGFTVVRYTHRSNVEGRGRMVGVVLDFLAGRPETAHVTGWIGAGFSMGCRAMCAAAAPVAPEGGAKDDTHGFGSDLRGLCLFAYPLYEESKGEVRDKPLTTLKLPILMVKGTHDGMSPDNVWNPVMERMQTPNKTIELVEGGGHGLEKPGHMKAACAAAVAWADNLPPGPAAEDATAATTIEIDDQPTKKKQKTASGSQSPLL